MADNGFAKREDCANMWRPEDIASAVIYAASQPEHVSVELLVINPARRSEGTDYERYLAEGHTQILID